MTFSFFPRNTKPISTQLDKTWVQMKNSTLLLNPFSPSHPQGGWWLDPLLTSHISSKKQNQDLGLKFSEST